MGSVLAGMMELLIWVSLSPVLEPVLGNLCAIVATSLL